jgi:hypothetical protein
MIKIKISGLRPLYPNTQLIYYEDATPTELRRIGRYLTPEGWHVYRKRTARYDYSTPAGVVPLSNP